MNEGQLVVGYHGCDITTRDDLVAGRATPQLSHNRYDWLGPGFYIFENDHDRAEAFARTAAAAPERRLTARPIAQPAVVGCLLSVQRCLDMTTHAGVREFEAACMAVLGHDGHSPGRRVPANRARDDEDADNVLRHLDNAIFNHIHRAREAIPHSLPYQAVRGAFQQGAELVPRSGFHRDSHIQIALRDLACVIGWFLPQLNELLAEAAYRQALLQLERVRQAHPKPRQRLPPSG
ncbi:hypothetical protein [Stenotrophomonas panacihumi]|uniref:hypothetical protein n=1 Tax=Stenotrophomonas panacihumi TaxID=676599 RepID=UPI0009D6BF96|nr:hypothetical protein [Stenotrophomonas panacihumi]PTN53934.1 hypothetical protein C9J98_13090 [Stenotrophomonas panacihumi]